MDCSLDDRYPPDAAFGADYLTSAAQGDVIEDTPDGPRTRRERIIITDRFNDYEGRVCIGERTARHLARLFGMVDGWRVEAVLSDNAALRAEVVRLSTQLADTQTEAGLLRDLEHRIPAEVFVALDGTRHASKRACQEATATYLGVDTTVVLAARTLPTEQIPLEVAP